MDWLGEGSDFCISNGLSGVLAGSSFLQEMHWLSTVHQSKHTCGYVACYAKKGAPPTGGQCPQWEEGRDEVSVSRDRGRGSGILCY